VVPKAQETLYRDQIVKEWNEPLPEVVGLPDDWRIGETRLEIGRMAAAQGAERFLMVDDDITFLVRQGIGDWRLRQAEHSEVEEMLVHAEEQMLRAPHIKLVSVSPREGNNRVGVGPPEDLHMTQLCQRIHRFYLWDTAEFLALEHCRVPVAEDFDHQLQTIGRGNLTALVYYWAQGQRMTGDEGGCSDYRSVEFHNAAVLRLADLHPGLVEVYQKNGRAGTMESRLESRIAWKRAAGL
jgi:hypothetical protein